MNRIDSFANRMLAQIKESDITYEELSKRTGIPAQTLNRWALEQRVPKVDVVAPVAAALGVHPLWLSGYEVDRQGRSYESPTSRQIPILGTIAAGAPLYAEQYIEDYLSIPVKWAVDFALNVRGTSMINAGIPDGSVVLCCQQNDVDDGEIAVCIIDGENATLKRVKHYGNVLVLHPENPEFEDLVFSGKEKNNVKIVGVAKKVLKDI